MHVKNAQRLDDARLVEVLQERGMADPGALQELLGAARSGGTPFCEGAVTAKLIGDWEMSRVVAEMFHLPFLPIDIYRPDPALWEEVGSETFRKNAVVPMRRFGQLLTIAMPGLVSAEVLGVLAEETGCSLLPVVGTAQTNRRWVEEQAMPELCAPSENQQGGCGTLFGEGEAGVQAPTDEEAQPVNGENPEPPSLVARKESSERAGGHEVSPLDPPPSVKG